MGVGVEASVGTPTGNEVTFKVEEGKGVEVGTGVLDQVRGGRFSTLTVGSPRPQATKENNIIKGRVVDVQREKSTRVMPFLWRVWGWRWSESWRRCGDRR